MVEAQIVMVGAVVFIVSAVLIYLISAFTMKEKTFEEVIEEQRRQKELEEAKIKQEKKAEKDARRRKKPKEKSKGDQSPRSGKTESVTVVEHKMVNLEIEPEIIEPVAPEVPLKMGKKKDRPTKTILHNRDEKTPVVSEDNVEEFIHGPVPRDDVELKHSHIKQDKKKKDKQKQVQVVEEIIQIKQTTVQAAAPPAAESKVNFKEGGNTKLISTVKTANLSDNETQQLVEILLNKQGGASVGASSGWNKSNASNVLEKRLDELSQELRKGEAQNATLTKNLQTKEQAVDMAQKECASLRTKLQELETALTASDMSSREIVERLKAADRQKIDTDGNLKNLQKKIESLEQEKSGLEKEKSALLTDVQDLRTQVEAQKKKNNDLREKNWKAMDALDKSEKSLNEKVQSAIKTKTEEVQVIQSEFEKYDQSVLTRLFPDISVSNKSSAKFETEISDLKSRLSSAEAYTAELESRVETAESELQKAEALTSKSDISVHEIETALREAEANRDRLQSALDESESSCSKLQTQVAQYRNVLGETLKSEIASLQQQSSTAPDSQEMKEKVANLETQLQASDDRCSQLQSELQQTESKVTEYNIKIVELEKSGSTIVEINTELETIKTSLAAEQKKNKDLASQIVKLNGIIKTGHDALTQEQNLASSQSSLNEAGTGTSV
ncbi:KTN1-like protein [Mya arenaria]|uniref:KTN1-like protein n=1 Tax=Mya arenaria TaxID=6604 RepID=A0ABY7FG80_MYAAR|nr:KTN1-like protein [Mya arenaria]